MRRTLASSGGGWNWLISNTSLLSLCWLSRTFIPSKELNCFARDEFYTSVRCGCSLSLSLSLFTNNICTSGTLEWTTPSEDKKRPKKRPVWPPTCGDNVLVLGVGRGVVRSVPTTHHIHTFTIVSDSFLGLNDLFLSS